MVYKYFDKKLTLLAQSETLATREKSTSGSGVKSEIISNQELAEQLHKSIIRKFEYRKVHLSFTDNIWGVDKRIRFLLCVIDIFSKQTWVVPVKKGITITNTFQNALYQSNRKPNKI